MAWQALEGPTSSEWEYWAAYRPAGHTHWLARVRVMYDMMPEPGCISLNSVTAAVSPQGVGEVGISSYDPGSSANGWRVDVVVHQLTGQWRGTKGLSAIGTSASGRALAFDGHGNLTAAYLDDVGGIRDDLITRTRKATSVGWGPETDVTAGIPNTNVDTPPQSAVAPNGNAVIGFQLAYSGGPNTNDATAITRVGPTGVWTAPSGIAVGGSQSSPTVTGIASNGRAYVLYDYTGGSPSQDFVGTARAMAGSPVRRLPPR